MTGALALAAAVLIALVLGLVHRSRDGRLRPARPTPPTTATPTTGTPPTAPGLLGELAALGERPGDRATLLQFSSAFCAPCRATRRTLGEIATMVDGVRHVEVDAEAHLDVVRRLGIRKTPTTLVLDAGGREVVRASGQPRKADVLAALGQVVQA